MEEEKKALVCMRVSDMPEPNTDASLKFLCGTCKEAVWVSGAGQSLMEKGDVEIVCLTCIKPHMDAQPPEEKQVIEITGSVLAEALDQMLIDAERNGAQPRHVFGFVKSLFELSKKEPV